MDNDSIERRGIYGRTRITWQRTSCDRTVTSQSDSVEQVARLKQELYDLAILATNLKEQHKALKHKTEERKIQITNLNQCLKSTKGALAKATRDANELREENEKLKSALASWGHSHGFGRHVDTGDAKVTTSNNELLEGSFIWGGDLPSVEE